jgi:hypothetical protein
MIGPNFDVKVPHEIEQHLTSPDPNKKIIAVMAEWMKGCTCSDQFAPWECKLCTAAAVRAIREVCLVPWWKRLWLTARRKWKK